MGQDPERIRAAFRTLRMIFVGLISGQVLLLIVTIFLRTTGVANARPEWSAALLLIVPLAATGAVLAAAWLTKPLLARVPADASLEIKLGSYSTASILRLALLESAGLFSLIALLLTGGGIFLGVFAPLVIAQLVMRPSPEDFVARAPLTPAERGDVERAIR